MLPEPKDWDRDLVRAFNELLSCAMVARLAGVTTETVRFWDRSGKLTAMRLGNGTRMFHGEDVKTFLAKRRGRLRRGGRAPGSGSRPA